MANFQRKIYIILVQLLILSFISVHSYSVPEEKEDVINCDAQPRCSGTIDRVWATDGKTCNVYRNFCLYWTAYCANKDLKQVPQEECQKLCRKVCPKNLNFICASFDEKFRTFVNECLYEKHVCLTGELYNINNFERCANETYLKS